VVKGIYYLHSHYGLNFKLGREELKFYKFFLFRRGRKIMKEKVKL
jgi:hypothetical protein